MDRIKLNQNKIINIGVVAVLTATVGYISYSTSQIKQENYELKKKSTRQTMMIDKLNDANMKLESQKSNFEKERDSFKDSIDKLKKEKLDETNKLNDRLYKVNQEHEALKVSKAKEKHEKDMVVANRGSGSNATPSASNIPKQEVMSEVKVEQPSKEKEKPKQSKPNTTNVGGWRTFNASAYTSDPAENGGYSTTALGTPLRSGVVAVDPSVIPLGSKIQIATMDGSIMGTYSCEDTGGAIKSNRLDILFASKSQAYSFGRRQVKIRLVQ